MFVKLELVRLFELEALCRMSTSPLLLKVFSPRSFVASKALELDWCVLDAVF